MKNYLELDPEEYVDIMSLKKFPYYEKETYPVPDNWWKSEDYYNAPLEPFMDVIRNAVTNGYSVCIVGDNSEPGFCFEKDAALIPDFDIPSDYINDDARQMRFSHDGTTDDHAIHLVGITEKNGREWFLIKDSGTRGWAGPNKGYMFYREDFIRLKMMNIMVHRDAAEKILIRYRE